MPDENTTACKIPPRWFRKKETVMGIIGNTQGVKIAARPSPKAVIRNASKPLALGAAGEPAEPGVEPAPALVTFTATAPGLISVYPAGTTYAAGAAAAGSMVIVNETVFFRGGKHCRSLHA